MVFVGVIAADLMQGRYRIVGGVMVAVYAPSRTIRLHELCTSTRQPTSFDAAVIISINARVSSITIEPNPSDEEGRLGEDERVGGESSERG